MSLKGLIENQTIIIDDHKRGSREIKNWDDESNDVHIDKTTNFPIDGKRQKVRIRIPINSNRPIKIQNQNKDALKKIPKKLEKEIREAFENTEKRMDFIREIIQILKNFKTSLRNEDRAKQILENLSNHFGLKWTGEKIATYVKEVLMVYTEVFEDEKGENFFMKIDKDKIEIGQNTGYAKRSRKINRK